MNIDITSNGIPLFGESKYWKILSEFNTCHINKYAVIWPAFAMAKNIKVEIPADAERAYSDLYIESISEIMVLNSSIDWGLVIQETAPHFMVSSFSF